MFPLLFYLFLLIFVTMNLTLTSVHITFKSEYLETSTVEIL